MFYRVLCEEEIPHRDPDAILAQRHIDVAEAAKPRRTAEENPRTLVEAAQPDEDGTLAAYIDLEQSNSDPRSRIGIEAVVRAVGYESASLFAVDCHAVKGCNRMDRCFHVHDYAEARRRLIAFIDYAATWLEASNTQKS
jgi:hypothetical protein